MWGSKKIETNSNFFEGINFIKKCFDDFFEIFTNAIQKTNLEPEKLSVPKIIVIGSESSGKSSLLENIVKCQLFPKNTTFCTKIPIHLILKNTTNEKEIKYKLYYDEQEINTCKENIYKEIEKLMDNLKEDIYDNKIIRIEIIEKNIVDFEFYDLPGIRAYPPKLAEKTKKIAKKYLAMEDVIPICVIPATTPRITSYIPMALIKEYNKEENTFICLTMCDRLQDENIEELLINRVIQQTDEYDSNTFSGICGIINRTHKNNIKLSDNDNFEKDWFDSNIYSNMPFDYVHKKELLENLGINNLVKKLSHAYKNYIGSKWLPNLIDKIEKENNKLNNEIINIGFDPEDKNQIEKFINCLKKIFDNEFRIHLINIYNSIKLNNDYTYNVVFNSDFDNDIFNELYNIDIPIFKSMIEISESNNVYQIPTFLKKIQNYEEINEFIINIDRFSKFKLNFFDTISFLMSDFIVTIKKQYINQISYDFLTLELEQFKKKIDILSISIIKELKNYIYFNLFENNYDGYGYDDNVPEPYPCNKNKIRSLLDEDKYYKDLRKELKNKIKNNNEAINDLEKIIIVEEDFLKNITL